MKTVIAPPLQPELDTESAPPTLIGNCKLAAAATRGDDLAPVWNSLVERVTANPLDAAAYLDLSTIALIQNRPSVRSELRARALELSRVYRIPPAASATDVIRVLSFQSASDYLPNMPVEFLLDDSNVALDLVYVTAGLPLPQVLPDHDVAFVAVAESSENQPLLKELAVALQSWRRPVINRPELIAPLTRDGTWSLLNTVPGLDVPINVHISRMQLEQLGADAVPIRDVLDGFTFPIIARPLDSHLGEGLCKLDNAAAIRSYLCEQPDSEFYLAPFIDYKGRDGLYRKYRVVLIDGRPHPVHMAIAPHWMINYVNANMEDSAQKRGEEARFMANFDRDFAARHADALAGIADRTGLEYLPLDCAEAADGRLLLFELGTNMIVHKMDPEDVFPYKRPQMDKLSDALKAMFRRRSDKVSAAA
jgi:glutathione synthase/RimK-type ligase-like ATP-grasp enzyme